MDSFTQSGFGGGTLELSALVVEDEYVEHSQWQSADWQQERAGLALSIIADRSSLRNELREDALEAGFRIGRTTDLHQLSEGSLGPLGDVVFVDCPFVDAAVMAGLSRLDQVSARCGIALVVSTGIDALEDVFACLDQSQAKLLVGPSRAERIIALGQVVAERPAGVRELSEADRMMLARLTEQVHEIAMRLERIRTTADQRNVGSLDAPADEAARTAGVFSFADFPLPVDPPAHAAAKAPAMPSASFIRTIIRQRQMRARFFPSDMFTDPAWDILLDLSAARAEHKQVSVTSLAIASGVPPTTALRWISQMTERGFLRRECDNRDRRRAFVALTETAVDAVSRYFAALGPAPVAAI